MSQILILASLEETGQNLKKIEIILRLLLALDFSS